MENLTAGIYTVILSTWIKALHVNRGKRKRLPEVVNSFKVLLLGNLNYQSINQSINQNQTTKVTEVV